MPLVLDLRIAHDRVGSNTDPTLNGHLRYPNNLDQSLNDTSADKIRKYRVHYNHNPPSTVSFMPPMPSTSGRLVNLSDFYSWNLIGKLTDFLQFQEFTLYKQIVECSTTVARFFLLYSNLGLEIFSPRLQLYVLRLI